MLRGIIFIAFAVGLYWGLKWFFGKRDGTCSDMPNRVFFLIAFALAIGLVLTSYYWGTKTPGSFFERGHYQGMFYVNLFPDGLKVKSYRVPAMISCNVGSDAYDDSYYSWREYRIEFAVMPNGGTVTFNDNILELGRIVTMYDENGRYWGVELTDRPVRK